MMTKPNVSPDSRMASILDKLCPPKETVDDSVLDANFKEEVAQRITGLAEKILAAKTPADRASQEAAIIELKELMGIVDLFEKEETKDIPNKPQKRMTLEVPLALTEKGFITDGELTSLAKFSAHSNIGCAAAPQNKSERRIVYTDVEGFVEKVTACSDLSPLSEEDQKILEQQQEEKR
jgi:hypothetical protein